MYAWHMHMLTMCHLTFSATSRTFRTLSTYLGHATPIMIAESGMLLSQIMPLRMESLSAPSLQIPPFKMQSSWNIIFMVLCSHNINFVLLHSCVTLLAHHLKSTEDFLQCTVNKCSVSTFPLHTCQLMYYMNLSTCHNPVIAAWSVDIYLITRLRHQS